jgi:type IV pilus assembly protein PilY1
VTDPALGTKVMVTLQSEYAAGSIIQHLGYIISGTTADGTYLEVRDYDTAAGSDVHFFLDTPPVGYTTGLPLSATRFFTPGDTLAATLLKDPLWYAAKWGGFNDLNGNGQPDLESEWDADGDGNPDNYYLVVNPLKLEQQLTRSFSDILSRGVSHVAPVVSVDEANRTQSGDKLYLAFFKPMSDAYWQGNIKKYGLDFIPRPDCGRDDPEWTVVDQFGAIAGACDGLFQPTSRSYWSSANDGGYVDRGGVGERLKASMPGSDPVLPATTGPYWDFRNIYTYNGAANGSLVRFIHANISNTDLAVPDDYARYRIINFMYGYTYDSKTTANPDPKEKRVWILGDIIHSEPRIIDYLNPADSQLQYRYVVVGANDGMMHVFDDTSGDEIFAFIPTDLLPRLQEFSDPSTHLYMLDSTPYVFRSFETDPVTGYYKKTLVFGERRGGRSYWALDVTDPNPLNWKLKWKIQGGSVATGGTLGFEELGYSWSKPLLASLQTGPGTIKNAFIFAGGYDLIEDGFPEAFNDTNGDGIHDSDETFAVTVGGTEGYDAYNPSKDRMGRGIFVVDADTGSLLFKAAYGDDDGDGDESEDVKTGVEQRYAKMKYCFPADISVLPFSETNIVMYAADIYGQIWKVAYNYLAENEAVAYNASASTRWTVKRVFASNPGSDMPSGNVSAFQAIPSLNASDTGRKTFYSPDVSYFGNDWTAKPVLYFGTGDREHPRYAMISNRFYVVADSNALANETDLLNLTCDELDDNADANGDGNVDEADATIKGELTNLLYDGSALGFYKILGEQGNCVGDSIDHTGEQVLSQPTVFFKNVYFTSYQPTFNDPCNPLGNAFIYALDYSFGTATFNYNVDNDLTDATIRNLSDTYRMITGTSIPSGVKIITRNGTSAGMVSVGGAVVGAGEGGSTTIPGPPGGAIPILWETD